MEAQDIIISVLMSAINYIIISTISAKQTSATVADLKQVLTFMRNDQLTQTKENYEDVMSQLKETRADIMTELKELKSKQAQAQQQK